MYLAIDIGGTKTLIALFSPHGVVLRKTKFKTSQSLPRFISDLTRNLEPYKKRKIRSVIMAVPGVVQKNCSARLGNRNWGDVDFMSSARISCAGVSRGHTRRRSGG